MSRLSRIAFAACACLLTTAPAAFAADMPTPVYEPVPVPPAVVGGWYLRGDIGFSNQKVDSLYNVLYEDYDDVDTVQKDFDAAPFLGIGVGYRLNNWFRADITGEYRGAATFHGLDIADSAGVLSPNDYRARKSEWLALANLYVDMGTYYGITPFVGAGIGVTRTTISDFRDEGVTLGSLAYGDDESSWDLAWALYAGLAYNITPAFSVELAYRYLHLGDAESGDLISFDGTNDVDNPMEFNDLSSHDLKLGVRYQFN